MLYATHYEPEEFEEIVKNKQLKVFARCYVLYNGIAGTVYMCHDDHNLYYQDRLIPTEMKKEEFNKMDMYEVHQELYAKINMDESMRRLNG